MHFLKISVNISLKFVPRNPMNNIPALVQIMAWRRSGDKPLYEPMMVNLPMHICVTRPQWVKCVIFQHILKIYTLSISSEIASRWMPQNFIDDKSTLVQVMAWCRQATSHYLSQVGRSILPYHQAYGIRWANEYSTMNGNDLDTSMQVCKESVQQQVWYWSS